MIAFLKRVLLLVILISNSAFAGSVEGSLNDQPLPSAFENLQTRGSSEVTCNGDSDSISSKIVNDGNITTHDGQHTFNLLILSNEDQNTCYGQAYHGRLGKYDPIFICALQWEKGNWQNTLSCKE